jgi:antitoxin (DNA-binding transcriptional repressor) of toxin-antitoxin stability system
MSTISVREIQLDPATFVHRLECGESFVLVKDNRPLAQVSPITHPTGERRPYGLAKGEFVVPEDFDQPLPDEVLAAFEGR